MHRNFANAGVLQSYSTISINRIETAKPKTIGFVVFVGFVPGAIKEEDICVRLDSRQHFAFTCCN